jgi:hypothetical protein
MTEQGAKHAADSILSLAGRSDDAFGGVGVGASIRERKSLPCRKPDTGLRRYD